MIRSTRVLRRAKLQDTIRRYLHEDSRGDFLGFSSANAPGADPRFGMDMTRAPGYEVAADEEPPLVGNQKLADFAVRHARLSSAQVGQADGYMWIGSVLYPTNYGNDVDVEFSWEREVDDQGLKIDFEKPAVLAPEHAHEKQIAEDDTLQAARRYTGGQARRVRKERERNAVRRAHRRLRRKGPPVRRPENDIPDDEEG